MFKFFTDLFVPKKQKGTIVINNDVVTQRSLWRNNMWIMTPDGIGIVFSLNEPCLVHLVAQDGTTSAAKYYNTAELRQARYLEIPEGRRGDPEKAARLGYL